MLFSRSVLLLLSAAIYSSGAAEPEIVLTEPDDRDAPLVIGPDDYDINATFECRAEGTTTLWRVDNYLLVDRDQFERQGLSVLDPRQGLSMLVFRSPTQERKGGFVFVFESLDKCYFTLHCLPATATVNVMVDPTLKTSVQTVASCHCIPEEPKIAIEDCDGDRPRVRVTSPPNFDGHAPLDYNFTTDKNPSGKIVASESAKFTYVVEDCGKGCEICVTAMSCVGVSEEVCVKNENCYPMSDPPCVPDQQTFKRCELKCKDPYSCYMEFEIEYVISCGKTYYYCEDKNCRALKSPTVNVTVPVNSLSDYTGIFMACINDNICFNATTSVATATCNTTVITITEPDDCDIIIFIIIIVVVFVLSLIVGTVLGAVVGYCIWKKKGRFPDSLELMEKPRSP